MPYGTAGEVAVIGEVHIDVDQEVLETVVYEELPTQVVLGVVDGLELRWLDRKSVV